MTLDPLRPPLVASPLVGPRVRLRELRDADADALFQIHGDREWVWPWGIPVHHDLAATRQMIADLRAEQRDGRQLRWAMATTDSDQPIGVVGFCRFVREHYRAELSYVQSRAACGRGYMSEAIGAVAQFGFTTLGLHSIEAGVDPRNTASQRLLGRLRFRREGYLRENYCLEGRFLDTIVYSRLCTD